MNGKPINYQRCDDDYSSSVFLLDLQNFTDFQGVYNEKTYALMSILMVLMSSCVIINVKSLEGLSSLLKTLTLIPFDFEIKNQLKVYILYRDRTNCLNIHEIQVSCLIYFFF